MKTPKSRIHPAEQGLCILEYTAVGATGPVFSVLYAGTDQSPLASEEGANDEPTFATLVEAEEAVRELLVTGAHLREASMEGAAQSFCDAMQQDVTATTTDEQLKSIHHKYEQESNATGWTLPNAFWGALVEYRDDRRREPEEEDD